MSNTALACQQNHWRQVTRGDAGSQSFASTRLTSFRVVRHCAQTDNRPSLVTKGGEGLKAWFGMENKGSLQLPTLLFKMLPDWSGMRDNINSHGQEWGIINNHFVAYEKNPKTLYCQFWFAELITDPAPLQLQWPWERYWTVEACVFLKEKGKRRESVLQLMPLRIPVIVQPENSAHI